MRAVGTSESSGATAGGVAAGRLVLSAMVPPLLLTNLVLPLSLLTLAHGTMTMSTVGDVMSVAMNERVPLLATESAAWGETRMPSFWRSFDGVSAAFSASV